MRGLSLIGKAFLSVGLIILPIILAFVYGYEVNKSFYTDALLGEMTIIAEAYEGQVYQFLDMSKRQAEHYASDGFIRQRLEDAAAGRAGAASALRAHLVRNKLPLDASLKAIHVARLDGRIVSSTDEGGSGADVGAAAFFRNGLRSSFVTEMYGAGYDFPALLAATPVRSMNGAATIGVLLTVRRLSELNKLMTGEYSRELGALTSVRGRHETMESYIVNRDSLMLTESKFVPGAVLRQKVDTPAVSSCFGAEPRETSAFYGDYRGVRVGGASMCIPSMGWALVVETDEAELVAPLNAMKVGAIVSGAVVIFLVGGIFLFYDRNMIRPLKRLARASEAVAEGRYDGFMPVSSSDEIGSLVASFNEMARQIKERTGEIKAERDMARRYLDVAGVIIVALDENGSVTLINRRGCELLECAESDIIGKNWFDEFIPAEIREELRSEFREGLARRPVLEYYEDPVLTRIGRERLIGWHNSMPIFQDGRVALLCSGEDITERRADENRLRSLNRMLKMLSECNESMVRATDEAALLSRVCEVIIEYGGYRMAWAGFADNGGDKVVRPAAVAGRDEGYVAAAGIRWDDSERGRGPTGTAIRTGRAVKGVFSVDSPGTGPWRVEALKRGFKSSIALPLKYEDRVFGALNIYAAVPDAFDEEETRLLTELADDLAYGISALRAHAEHKRAEEAVRISEEKYRTLFEESKDAVVMWDAGGTIIDLNPAGVALFGYATREDALGADIAAEICVDAERKERFSSEIRSRGYVVDFDMAIRRKDGKPLSVLITANCVKGEDGAVRLYRGIFHDISEHKRLEGQLLQAQKMEAVGQLTGGIAHDFNNLLTSIINSASLLEMGRELDPKAAHYVKQILTASERAATLTRSLLAFSRKQIIEIRPVDLNDVVKGMEKLLGRLIGEDIAFSARSASAGRLAVMADRGQIEQVLMNLATNARDAMPGGGRITVTTSVARIDEKFIRERGFGTDGDWALLTVSDTGVGMDDAVKARIFEPFFTTKEFGRGTGLGLSIVFGIIKQHNGHIDVLSTPGAGTTFEIYLPLADAAKPVDSDDMIWPSPMPPGGTETILLAEDDATVRSVEKDALERFGYTVLEAVDGDDAITKFMENADRVALAVLDVVMPRKNGREVFDALKKAKPSLKILFSSGYNEEIIHRKCVLDEGFELVSKPVDPAGLLRKVREILDRR